ncbi:MAG TPA: multidrug ABC transporter ATP-binding protein [Acholeplasmataceae bacterium]|nr:multidrug ABC transporter ATP-binding protein [Acholeplasmataceae bacterium]
MFKILKFLKPYKWGVILVFVLVALRAGLDLLLPMILGLLVSDGIGLSATSVDPNVRRIWELALLMLGATLLSIGVTIISGLMESKISAGFALDLRKAVYQKIEQFSLKEMDHFSTSSLITRSTNDIQQLQGFVNTMLRMIILAPFLAIGAIAFSIAQHPTLSMLLIVSIISLVVMISIIFAITLPKFQLVQKLVDRLNLVTRENLTGLRVVRAYNTQEKQAKRIDDASKESMKLNIFVNRIMSLMWPIMGLIMGMTSLAIVYLGSKYFIGIDGFDPGSMMALMQYAMRAIMAFMFITMIFVMIPRAVISAKRVLEVLEMDIEIKDPESPISLPSLMKGEIEFKDVCFQYPDAQAPVLSHINFTIQSGKTTAFIGSTGSGKSTLINLIPRFYERTCGSITIDGIDIKDMTQHDLHGLIGYVPQKGVLFSGTITDNILFGKDEFDANLMKEAAEIAQATEFIDILAETYDHQIAQGGTNVSGGQRQRLSIARAIAKKPLIYIFDDSFSALDYKTDQKLRKMLDQRVVATKLIVAQRINTIRHADQIIVLDQGSIVGNGTHEQLLKSCSVYQEIASSQLSKEELI